MKDILKYWRNAIAMAVAVLILSLAVPTTSLLAYDDDEMSKVIPRDANKYGNSYGEWSARWLQWAFSIPLATNPIVDTDGSNCGEGQSGPVWFLAGTFGGPPVTRNCNVPSGKALFFPLVEGAFGAGVFDCEPTVPNVTCNLATLRMAAAASMNSVTLKAILDGMPLGNLKNQRVQSPALTITYPPDNVLGVPQGSYAPNVVDGYWLMLAPLSNGRHTLYFKAEITGGVFAGAVIEVTYKLRVGP